MAEIDVISLWRVAIALATLLRLGVLEERAFARAGHPHDAERSRA